MINKVKLFAAVLVIATMGVMSGCLNSDIDDTYGQLTKEVNAINAYLDANKVAIEAGGGRIVKDPGGSGIAFVITELGKELPARGDSSIVKVQYKGYLFDGTMSSGLGTQFDQGTWNANLLNSITGFSYALKTLPLGTKAKVFIPSFYAYKTSGQGPIPGNTTLVFDFLNYENVSITDKQYNRWLGDTTKIEDYLDSKSVTNFDTLTFFDPNTTDQRKNMGIRYKIETVGAGPNVSWFDIVQVNIKYYNITDDTKIVYQNQGGAVTTSPVLERGGIRAALMQLKEGGKGRFYIPSGLAFGPVPVRDNTTGGTLFTANSNVIVDIEVVDVTTRQ